MTHYEIVKKLIGDIQPAGDSSIDPQRLQNLKDMCQLVNELVSDINDVAYRNKNAYQHSIKEMGNYADNFLTTTLGIN